MAPPGNGAGLFLSAPPLRRIVRYRWGQSLFITVGMRALKPLLSVALCLILLATSVTQAIARGQMTGGQMVQLCAGGKAITLTVDAQGNPIEDPHPCPDCIAVTDALPPVGAALDHPLARNMRQPLPVSPLWHAQPSIDAFARGPPVLI